MATQAEINSQIDQYVGAGKKTTGAQLNSILKAINANAGAGTSTGGGGGGTKTPQTIDTSTLTWSDQVVNKDGTAVQSNYNKTATIDVTGYVSLEYVGRKWSTSASSDLDTFATVIGKKSDGTYVFLIPGIVVVGGFSPVETISGIDISGFTTIYVLKSNDPDSNPFPTIKLS